MQNDDSFVRALIGDGRPLLKLVALVLIGCGVFALFQSATGHFLPHDTEYLGMTAQQLCTMQGCRIVHFMMHDRASFGGVLIALGIMYLWLIDFPLRRGEAWPWWTIAVSGVAGFLSFLTYLGYGYLDTWHGLSTLALLPLYVWGLAKTRRRHVGAAALSGAATAGAAVATFKAMPLGQKVLLLATFGIVAAGLTIMTVGMTRVFVPQDLEFIGIDKAHIGAIHRNLIPLIAHDRAGFGGGLASCGITMLMTVWCARLTRSLWQALLFAGIAGFATAVGVHPIIGYNNATHLAPAVGGALLYFIGIVMTRSVGSRASRTVSGSIAETRLEVP
jgi:hypothetical protein